MKPTLPPGQMKSSGCSLATMACVCIMQRNALIASNLHTVSILTYMIYRLCETFH